jgi:hypothetical protein
MIMRAEGMTVIPMAVVGPDNEQATKAKTSLVTAPNPVGSDSTISDGSAGGDQARLGDILALAEERRRQNARKRAQASVIYSRHKSKNAPVEEKGQKLNKAV